MSASATARRFFDEIWSQGQLDRVGELIAPEYVGHPSGHDETTRGPEEVRDYIGRLRDGVPDLTMTIEDQLTDGDKVTTRWTARGTHSGALLGVSATGRTAIVTGITIQRVGATGKIVEGWTSWDALGLLEQLGVLPADRVSA